MRAYRRYRRHGFDPYHTGPVELLMGAAVLLRREVFFRRGRWDEDFAFGGEDLELAAHVGQHHPILFASTIEVTHHGRVSSRLNIGFSTESVAIGYVQYLRKVGSSRSSLLLYKLAVTLDTPLQLAAKLVQWGGRRLVGRTAKAAKSRLAAVGLAHFLFKSLRKFWQS